MVRATLLQNTRVNDDVPPHAVPMDILTDKVRVPAEETTYWCKVVKLPQNFMKKHHVYKVCINLSITYRCSSNAI